MRYPYTYSLLVVLSIFAVFALSGCERASIRPYPQEPALPELPTTVIDITAEDMVVPAPEENTDTTSSNPEEEPKAIEQDTNVNLADTDSAEAQSEQPETIPEPEPTLEELIRPVYFALDEYALSVEDKMRLNKLADLLNRPENRNLRLRIEGHCDDRGTREYNFALGERRAASVARFLRAQKIDQARIMTISYGKERPVALGTSEAIRAQNRRVQMIILMDAKSN